MSATCYRGGVTTRWLNPTEDRAWRGLRRLQALPLAEISRDLTRDSGLSDPDYDVLSNLSEHPVGRCRFARLADMTGWTSSRLSHHAARMEQRGLIERHECAGDQRGTDLVLTAEGWAALRVAAPLHLESVRRHVFDRLTTTQVQALADIVDALNRLPDKA